MIETLEKNERQAAATTPAGFDEERMKAFVEKMVLETSAAFTAPLVVLGDRLGIYKAMAGAGGLTPDDLAARTGLDTRYLREWLGNQAASGYVEYEPSTGRYTLPDEHAPVFADENHPAFLMGHFEIAASLFRSEPGVADAFRTGKGLGWHEHDRCLFSGCERSFRVSYLASLTSEWIPALDGVESKLRAGSLVADIGCGHGASTIIMGREYPESTFVGFDYHAESIAEARRRAEEAGLSDRVSFEVAGAKEFPGGGYDLVTTFDALHDMGDPVGAAAHIRQALAPDGTWMIVEPFAGDRVEDNLNPIGRIYYASSTMICTPGSRSQEVGLALGAQAGEARLREVVKQGGFSRFRRAAESPVNLVFEARP